MQVRDAAACDGPWLSVEGLARTKGSSRRGATERERDKERGRERERDGWECKEEGRSSTEESEERKREKVCV